MKLQLKSLWVAMLAVGMAACNSDDDQVSPTPVDPTPNTIELSKIGAYQSGIFAESAAEIPAYDAASKRLFVVNAQAGVLDVLDLSQPNQPVKIAEIQVHDIAEGAEVNSVAVHNGIVAIAIQAAVKTDPGYVALYQAKDLSKLAHVQVGALPDMLTFSQDGQTLLVANEGEPSDDYQVDPEGSISVIQLSNLTTPVVRTADFKAFNGQEAALRAQGVRIFGPNATAAQDFEPEYITVSQDGKTAWAALQENNALAKIDVVNAKVLAVYPLGFKDHGLDGNGMDVSDADGVDGAGSIKIQTWANVRGLYMPDAIASFDVAGKTYIVTANEGDARAWGEDTPEYFNNDTSKGFVEEWRVKHLVHADGFARRLGDDLPAHLSQLAKGAELNPDNFGYCGATAGNAGDCRKDHLLGRLNITWTEGYQKNADGTPKLNERGNLVYDHLYSFGARSVSIWTENSAQNGLELVWDSGDDFEQYIAEHHPEIFNANHEEAGMDNRSDNKGPEPEGVTLGQIGSKTFAFIGLERAGGVMVYDVSTPAAPSFVQYLNSREMSASTEQIELGQAGDLGPEGLVFIAAQDSPNGQPLLVVGNEVSGSTAVYQLNLK
ncbi:alkaline phosphatase [Acinetobacter indicus]|uniref:choice-of-anchor I family protein n=1 Tax=Acinetobacter indicus TaxID=756892 RepID=UPI0005F7ED1D|nr:choice-of-anchor I family protein [Acinetobacter indicus]KJV45235.1 alkaline phosphatase [Acinetobacter indicus]OUY08034.1 alkaline phosphatase [Acinetobacter indicus]